ncbi:hypothetical protein [Actinoallomurus acanthiterrae]
MLLIVGEYAAWVAVGVDQEPVGAFVPHVPDPAFGNRVDVTAPACAVPKQ